MGSLSSMGEFYVYVYRNPLKNDEIFYLGKGKEGRCKDHLTEARLDKGVGNRHKINTIKQIIASGKEPIIEFVDSNISEDQAFELEIFLISMIGRRDLGTGTLTNLTSGGEGAVGLSYDRSGENNPNYGRRGEDSIWWGRTHSEETRKKMSEALLGREFTEEHKAAMRKPKSEAGRAAIAQARLDSDYRPSEETKKLISEALKGRPSPMLGRVMTDETKAKISAAGKGRVSHRKGKKLEMSEEAISHLRQLMNERNEQIVTCPHCGKVGKYVGMIRWHFNNCKEKV